MAIKTLGTYITQVSMPERLGVCGKEINLHLLRAYACSENPGPYAGIGKNMFLIIIACNYHHQVT